MLCATHLLDRIWTILKEDRAYELRDVDGTPVSVEQARKIITTRYNVPKEVRQRNGSILQNHNKFRPENYTLVNQPSCPKCSANIQCTLFPLVEVYQPGQQQGHASNHPFGEMLPAEEHINATPFRVH